MNIRLFEFGRNRGTAKSININGTEFYIVN